MNPQEKLAAIADEMAEMLANTTAKNILLSVGYGSELSEKNMVRSPDAIKADELIARYKKLRAEIT